MNEESRQAAMETSNKPIEMSALATKTVDIVKRDVYNKAFKR